jgi:phosphoglycerate dehydrogenase-like enzyme
MVPAFTAGLWDDGRMARLDSLCEVPDREPLATFDDERAAGLLPRAEILLTGWGCPPLDGAVLERCPKLRAVVHAAGTVKSHITEACWERGLQVSSAAAANALPVAEFTLAAILFSNKRVFRLQRRYRELRKWRHWGALEPDLGNFDKVVGIVGASRVGRRVIELLRPFDFSVVVHDPYLGDSDATALGVKSLELDQLLRTSDVVSLHAPALPETHHLIDGRRLALLRDGTTLINTARGWIVDGDALIAELVSGRIDAVIDTTDPEILPPNSPLYDLPNVLLTPHIAGSMGMEVRRLTDLALDEIDRYISGQPFAHAVQREDLLRIA